MTLDSQRRVHDVSLFSLFSLSACKPNWSVFIFVGIVVQKSVCQQSGRANIFLLQRSHKSQWNDVRNSRFAYIPRNGFFLGMFLTLTNISLAHSFIQSVVTCLCFSVLSLSLNLTRCHKVHNDSVVFFFSSSQIKSAIRITNYKQFPIVIWIGLNHESKIILKYIHWIAQVECEVFLIEALEFKIRLKPSHVNNICIAVNVNTNNLRRCK